MTQENPIWLQGSPYSARLDRQFIDALFTEGVLSGMAVTQRGAGANMSVDIGIGRTVIKGDDQANQGAYICQCTALENLTGFTAAPSGGNERFDVVYQRVNDPNAGGPGGNNSVFGIVTGVAAAIGTAAIPATPTSAIPLARVRFIAGDGSITTAMITSMRIPVVAYGGDPIGSILEFSGPTASLDLRYIIADGRAISRTTYAAYFALVATQYGVGDGTTTFNVPDRRGRIGVCCDNMGGSAANRIAAANALGVVGGAATKTLAVSEMPAHAHTVNSHSHGGNTSTESVLHWHAGVDHLHSMSHNHPDNITFDNGDHSHWLRGLGEGSIAGGLGEGNVADITNTPFVPAFNTNTVGNHNHYFQVQWFIGTTGAADRSLNTGTENVLHTHPIPAESPGTNNIGGGTAFDITQPWIAMNFAVRVL